MGLAGVQYHRLILIADFIYASFTATKTRVFDQLPNQPAATAQVKYAQFILDPEVGYRLLDHAKLKIDGLVGYRYWHRGITVTATTPQLGVDLLLGNEFHRSPGQSANYLSVHTKIAALFSPRRYPRPASAGARFQFFPGRRSTTRSVGSHAQRQDLVITLGDALFCSENMISERIRVS
jgi:hypothetical protein